MKLVVGLGNPGRKYQGTRHNVGFRVLAHLAQQHGSGPVKSRFDAEVVEADLHGCRALLVSPLTYMNRSGQSVVLARDFYKLEDADLLIVCDDFNLDLGQLRIRAKGSAGGNNGLKDIINRLGTQEFSRLRVGIGPVPERWDPADFVLGKFTADQEDVVQQAVHQAAAATLDWAEHGVQFCMNRYNAGSNQAGSD